MKKKNKKKSLEAIEHYLCDLILRKYREFLQPIKVIINKSFTKFDSVCLLINEKGLIKKRVREKENEAIIFDGAEFLGGASFSHDKYPIITVYLEKK